MAVGAINTVRVFVADLEPVRPFFEGLLGLTVSAVSADFLVLQTGGAALVVEAADPGDAEEKELIGRFTGLSFVVEDISSTVSDLQAAGVRFDGGIEVQPWGASMAHFFDPAGNTFTLVEMPRE